MICRIQPWEENFFIWGKYFRGLFGYTKIKANYLVMMRFETSSLTIIRITSSRTLFDLGCEIDLILAIKKEFLFSSNMLQRHKKIGCEA